MDVPCSLNRHEAATQEHRAMAQAIHAQGQAFTAIGTAVQKPTMPTLPSSTSQQLQVAVGQPVVRIPSATK